MAEKPVFSDEDFSGLQGGQSSTPDMDIEALAKEYEDNKYRQMEELTSKIEGTDSYSALDALSAADLEYTHTVEDGFPEPDFDDLTMRNLNLIKEGNFDPLQKALVQEEQAKTKATSEELVKEEIERMLDVSIDKPIDEEKAKAFGTSGSLMLWGLDVLGFTPEGVVFDKEDAAAKNMKRRQADSLIEQSMKLIEQGQDPNTVMKVVQSRIVRNVMGQPITEADILAEGVEPGVSFGSATETVLPQQIIAEAVSGVGLYRTAKLAGSGSKVALERWLSFWGYDLAAESSFALLNEAEVNPVLSMVIVGLGVPATIGLIRNGPRGVKNFVKNVRTNNTDIYDKIKAATAEGKDSFSVKVRQAIDEVETGKGIDTPNVSYVPDSAVSTMAKSAAEHGDEGATLAAQKAVTLAATNKGEASKVAQTAAGTGPATHTALMPVKADLGDVIIAEKVADPLYRTDLAQYIHNATTISDNVAKHMLHDVLAAQGSEVPGIIKASIYHDKGVYIGGMAEAARESFRTGKIGGGSKFLFPTRYFKDVSDAVVGIPSSQEKTMRVMQANSNKVLKKIFKDATEQEAADLQQLLKLSTDANKTFIPVQGGLANPSNPSVVFSATDRVVRKYAESRMLMDAFWEGANQTTLQTWRNQGRKLIDDGLIGSEVKNPISISGKSDINGVKWTPKMKEDGWVAYKLHNTQNPSDTREMYRFVNGVDSNVVVKEIPDHIQAVPFRDGYSPIRYNQETSPYHIIKLTKGEKGGWRTERVAAGEGWEVDNAVSKLNKADTESKYFAIRKDDQAMMNDLVMDGDLSKLFRNMGKDDIESFKRALIADPRISAEEVEDILGYVTTFNYKKVQPLNKRARQRLRSAKEIAKNLDADASDVRKAILSAPEAALEPAEAAMANYSHIMSKYIAHGDWNQELQSMYVKRYGRVLDHDKWNANISFDGKLANVKGDRIPLSADDMALAKEAKIMQDHLRTVFGAPTVESRAKAVFWANKADKFYKDKKTKWVGEFIDKNFRSGVTEFVWSSGRKLGAASKLGNWAWSQIVVQPTVAVNSFIRKPGFVAAGLKDFKNAYLKAYPKRMAGKALTKEEEIVLNVIEHSGINTGIDFDYAHRVMEQMQGWSKSGGIKGVLGKAGKSGILPFEMGEGIGRGVIAFTERRVMMDEIMKGVHKRLKIKDIDTDAFNLEWKIRTNKLAGDFSKFNKPYWGKEGWLSNVTQFMSYQAFQADLMFGKGLTRKQRMSLVGAWLAVSGKQGIPFINDIEFLKERAFFTAGPDQTGSSEKWQRQLVDDLVLDVVGKDAPVWLREAVQRQVFEGVVTAATRGEVNIAQRISLGSFVEKFMDGLDYSELAGVGVSTAYHMTGDAFTSINDLLEAYQNDELSLEVLQREAQQATAQFPGISNMIASTRESIMTKRNTISIKDPTTGQRIQKFLGLNPGRAVSLSDREFSAHRSAKEWKDWMYESANEVASISKESPKVAQQRLLEHCQMLAEKNPMLLEDFLSVYIYALTIKGMDEKTRVQLYETKKGITPLNNYFSE